MPFCLALVMIAVVPTLITGKLRRGQGVIMLLIYIAYVALLVFSIG